MTVAEIKEYIDELVKECENELGENPYIVNQVIINKMYKFLDIKDMLDELERPKAHWENIGSGLECSQCGNIIQEWGEVIPEYCDCCGARMESEQ